MPGLEICTPKGWVTADAHGDRLVVHSGRELASRSAGRWPATVHRVRNPNGQEAERSRMACAYFVS